MAEEKVEEVLDAALDAEHLVLADESVRAALAEMWNERRTRRCVPGCSPRWSAGPRPTRSRSPARCASAGRPTSPGPREIFAAFRVNLEESGDRLAREIASPGGAAVHRRPAGTAAPRPATRWSDRLASLDGEEQREIAAIGERYADIKPHVTAAAVVFALTPADAEAGRIQP